jgi:hypothetical protein
MSSPTDNVKLIKPAPGADQGSWGNLLNTSLEQIDRLISGRLEHDVVATPIVPAIDPNTDDTSRSPMYVLTGSQAGDTTAFLPAITRVVWVKNATDTGSWTLTVRATADAGGGVVIPRGDTMMLVFDGLNMITPKAPTAVLADTATVATTATTATTAGSWVTPLVITFNGTEITGSATFDGAAIGDIAVALAVTDDGHAHTTSTITGLDTALGLKAAILDQTHTGNMFLPETTRMTGKGGVMYMNNTSNTGGVIYVQAGGTATSGTNGDITLIY